MQKLIGPLAGAVIAAALVACGGGSSSGSGNTGGQTSGGAIPAEPIMGYRFGLLRKRWRLRTCTSGRLHDLPTGFVQRATAKVLWGDPEIRP